MPELGELSKLRTNSTLDLKDSLAVVTNPADAPLKQSPVKRVPAGLVAQGFTHAWTINYDHPLLANNNANSGTIPLAVFTLTNPYIVDKVRAVITDPFVNPTLTADIDLGVDGTPTAFIASLDGALACDIAQNTGTRLATGPSQIGSTQTEDLIITIDAGADELGDFTAGQMVVLASIATCSDYANLVDASV